MTLVAGALAILAAALVKGAVAFGFPLVATPLLGLVAGVLGGLTNVPGTPMVLYFVALGLDKYEFVRAVAVTFIVVKVVQLGAVVWYGLLDLHLLVVSLAFTVVALGGFAVGLRLQ